MTNCFHGNKIKNQYFRPHINTSSSAGQSTSLWVRAQSFIIKLTATMLLPLSGSLKYRLDVMVFEYAPNTSSYTGP